MAKRGRKRKHTVGNILMILLIIGALIVSGMLYMKEKVSQTFANDDSSMKSETVTRGSLSTVVSGSGTLAASGIAEVTVPSGVEIDRIFYGEGSEVSDKALLFSVDSASVLSAMKDVQDQIDALDASLEEASADEVPESLISGVSGRVKKIYAQVDDDVSAVMYKSGALLTLSLDGYMAVDVEAGSLSEGDSATVMTSDGSSYTGSVDSVSDGTAVILVTDYGPKVGDTVTVIVEQAEDTDEEGSANADASGTGSEEEEESGDGAAALTGTLYIHSPLNITGYAGTVASVDVTENESVSSDTSLLTLTNTAYSANYNSILSEREALEETLSELIILYQEGGVYAPFGGKVDTISEGYEDLVSVTSTGVDTSADASVSGTTGASSSEMSISSSGTESSSGTGTSSSGTVSSSGTGTSSSGTASSSGTGTSSSGTASSSGTTASSSAEAGIADTGTAEDKVVLTLDPNKEMTVEMTVDETDILSLKTGQSAAVTIDSIGEDVFTGTVTQIDTTAASSSGVTAYTVQVTIVRDSRMLSSMSANVEITISGVENALLVPAEAVHQTSSSSYVYTTFDEETGEPGGMVEVTTGLTDGSMTEITDGLKEGDTVWYEEEETTMTSSFPGMEGGMGMNMGAGSREGSNRSGMNEGGGNNRPQNTGNRRID